MNIIIPMAGRGSRVRPHSITIPKPLLPIAGTPIVKHLIDTLSEVTHESIQNIGFIIGRDFGKDIEDFLLAIASEHNAKGHIFYQDKPEGIAHALLSAQQLLTGKTIIALADTLFVTNEKINVEEESVIFVQQVEDPSAFGVVTADEDGYLTALIEKPKEFVSNDAIVGIYYFKEASVIKKHMQYLIDKDIRTKNEYQLTDAIERFRKEGAKIATQQLEEWLDCGNKKNLLQTNKRILELHQNNINNNNYPTSVIIEPCYIAPDVVIENSVVGPYVSIGKKSIIKNSILKESVLQQNVTLQNCKLTNSMLGNFVTLNGKLDTLSLGDYSFSE